MDTLNRDVVQHLAENYLRISDASNLAKTAKCAHLKPTQTLFFHQGIEYCVRKGLTALLQKFPKEAITRKLLKLAIYSHQFKTAYCIMDHLDQNFNRVEFLPNELDKAIHKSDAKYLQGLLIFDQKRSFNEFSIYGIVHLAMKSADLECVKTICKHFEITDNIESSFALYYGRFDVVNWLSFGSNDTHIGWTDQIYWRYAHMFVFKITSLFGLPKNRSTLAKFNLILLPTLAFIFMYMMINM